MLEPASDVLTPAAQWQAAVRDIQAQGHVRSLGPATVASACCGLMAVWALQGQAGQTPLLAWLAVLLLVLLLRWLWVLPLRQAAPAGLGARLPWLRGLTLLHGLAWGALAWVVPPPATLWLQSTLVVLLGGVAVTGLTLALYDRMAAAAFGAAVLLPLATRLLLQEGPLPSYMGVAVLMLLLLGGAMSAAGSTAQRARFDMVRAAAAEAKLLDDARSAESVMRRVFDHVSEGLCLFDAQLHLVAWNDRMVDLAGVAPEFVHRGMHLRDLIVHMAQRGEYGEVSPEIEAERRMSQMAQNVGGVTTRVRADGRVVELRRKALPDGGFAMVAVDMTERQAVAAALADNRRMMSLLLQSTEEGVWFIDNALCTTDANPAMCRMLGLPHAQLLGRSIYEFVDAENERIFRAQVQRRAQGLPGSYEIALRRVDGSLVHCQNNPTPLFDAQGHKIGAVGLFTDISAQKRALAELQRTGAQLAAQTRVLQSTLQSLSQGVLSIAADGHVEAWNRRVLELLQLPESLLQSNPTLTQLIDWQRAQQLLMPGQEQPGSASGYEAALRYLQGDQQALWDTPRYQRRSPDGRIIEVEVHAAPGGAHVRTFSDVTDTVRSQQALISARDEAERANRAKSEFLSRMSHELRTPLNAVLGFAQLLDGDAAHPLQPAQRERVQQIQRGGAHLLALINEVLDLAAIESGALRVQRDLVDLDTLAHDSLRLVEAMAQAQDVTLRLRWPDDGLGTLAADSTRLRQVLLNLLANAIKYNRRGGHVELVGLQTPDGVRLEVHDSGPGLTAEQQQRLFQAFDRLDADRGPVEGTGIGLALSRALVELMDGRIGVRSRAGNGSCFWVELPRQAAEHAAPPAPAPEDRPAPVAAPAEPARPVAPRRVLYVEDNEVNQILVEGMLARLPAVQLQLAADAESGLHLARQQPPDLVLLDIQLPGINGYELRRQLQDDPATAHVPVVAVTANAMPEDRAQAQAAGFDDYLTKPLQLQALLDCVSHWLQR